LRAKNNGKDYDIELIEELYNINMFVDLNAKDDFAPIYLVNCLFIHVCFIHVCSVYFIENILRLLFVCLFIHVYYFNKHTIKQTQTGSLQKQSGDIFKKWKPFWFVLIGDNLKYFKSAGDKQAEGKINKHE